MLTITQNLLIFSKILSQSLVLHYCLSFVHFACYQNKSFLFNAMSIIPHSAEQTHVTSTLPWIQFLITFEALIFFSSTFFRCFDILPLHGCRTCIKRKKSSMVNLFIFVHKNVDSKRSKSAHERIFS